VYSAGAIVILHSLPLPSAVTVAITLGPECSCRITPAVVRDHALIRDRELHPGVVRILRIALLDSAAGLDHLLIWREDADRVALRTY
jgi:hypothetical protein